MYLGIDLGTGSLKCLLLDSDGRTVAESSAVYRSDTTGGDITAPGHGEIPVERWRRGLLEAMNGLPAQERQAVCAIGLSASGTALD